MSTSIRNARWRQRLSASTRSPEFLVGKPKFADIADKFIEFVQGARLIIHNAQFDIGFLNEELRKLGKPSMEEICGKDNIIDSMELAKAAFPQMHNSLDALCKRLEIDTTRRVKEGHGALLDAEPFRPGLPRS